MIIAVNTRVLLEELEGYGYFIREIFEILVRKYPEHQFYFLFDRPYNDQYIFASNVHGLVVPPPARLPLLWKYWFDFKIPFILKKIKADVFVSPDGYASLTTKVPQCMVIHDLGFLHYPEAYKKSHIPYLKRNTPKFLKKAKTIATVSQFSKDDVLKHYRISSDKINVVYSGVKNNFRPLPFDERTRVKEKYTGGCEYFIYVGAIQPRKNLVRLLKGFSVFKKRMQSSMKLVLAGRMAWKNEEFTKLLNTYKYKTEVLLTGYVPEEEIVSLVGSAYALVYPSLFEGFGVPVVEGMRSGVPVLTSAKTSMEEIAGDAALYFDPEDHSDIADKMMLIYKDEDLRKQLVEQGRTRAEEFTWERSAELLWQSIVKAAETR